MSQYKISIVIPTYNVAPYITRCINSLKGQSVNTFEIIFVDDCGSDESIKIAKKYARSNPNVKVIQHHMNQGTFIARKTGIENATGEYIVFLDPDDELVPNAIESINNLLNQNPDMVFYNSASMPSPKFWQSSTNVPMVSSFDKKESIIKKIINTKNLHRGIAGKAAKRNVLLSAYKQLNIQSSLVFGEDTLLLLALIYNSETFVALDSPLYIHHKNPTSITVQTNTNIIEANVKRLNEIIKIIFSIEERDASDKALKRFFINELKQYQLQLNKIIEKSFLKSIKNYIDIIIIKRSPKELAKMLVFILTVGFIQR